MTKWAPGGPGPLLVFPTRSPPLQSASHLAKGSLAVMVEAKQRALDLNRVPTWPHSNPPALAVKGDPTRSGNDGFGLVSTTIGGCCLIFRIEQVDEPAAFTAIYAASEELARLSASGCKSEKVQVK